jgi:hypothetical protein
MNMRAVCTVLWHYSRVDGACLFRTYARVVATHTWAVFLTFVHLALAVQPDADRRRNTRRSLDRSRGRRRPLQLNSVVGPLVSAASRRIHDARDTDKNGVEIFGLFLQKNINRMKI